MYLILYYIKCCKRSENDFLVLKSFYSTLLVANDKSGFNPSFSDPSRNILTGLNAFAKDWYNWLLSNINKIIAFHFVLFIIFILILWVVGTYIHTPSQILQLKKKIISGSVYNACVYGLDYHRKRLAQPFLGCGTIWLIESNSFWDFLALLDFLVSMKRRI